MIASPIEVWDTAKHPRVVDHYNISEVGLSIGDKFTRVCVVGVPEEITTLEDAINLHVAELHHLSLVGGIRTIPYKRVHIPVESIQDTDFAHDTYEFQHDESSYNGAKLLKPGHLLGVVTELIPMVPTRSKRELNDLNQRIKAYFTDAYSKERLYTLGDLHDEQFSMIPHRDNKRAPHLFDLDLFLEYAK